MTIDIKHFKEILLEEKQVLEEDLVEVAEKSEEINGDWIAKGTERDPSQADENVTSDSNDEYETNEAIVNTLEPRLRDTIDALDRIENGTFGKCEVCGNDIEEDRLEANPSARTCKEHM